MPAYGRRFKLRKCSHLLFDGGEKYGLAEWREGCRRACLWLHAQRKGLPRAQEDGMLDAGRSILVSEKLQAFYIRGSHEYIRSR